MRYTVETAPSFFDMVSSIVGREVRPGNTITFLSEVDLSDVESIRERAGTGQKPSYTAFVAKAVAKALREFPYANRRAYRRWWWPWWGVRLQTFRSCDVAFNCERSTPGVEVATFADVLRDVDQLSLVEITSWLRALATCDETNNRQWRDFNRIITRWPRWLAALAMRLPIHFPSFWAKYRGGAVLISSPAKYGVDGVLGTWTSPLGVSFGLVKSRPVVRQGQVVARPTVLLTLNWHRHVMAGAQAARFFRRIVEILEGARTEMSAYLPACDESAGRAAGLAGLSSATAQRSMAECVKEYTA